MCGFCFGVCSGIGCVTGFDFVVNVDDFKKSQRAAGAHLPSWAPTASPRGLELIPLQGGDRHRSSRTLDLTPTNDEILCFWFCFCVPACVFGFAFMFYVSSMQVLRRVEVMHNARHADGATNLMEMISLHLNSERIH